MIHLIKSIQVLLGCLLVAYCAEGQVIGTEIKLLAKDGASDDNFGWSIGVEDGVVAVGSRLDDDNGIDSGSVYLFDAFTGNHIQKLLPNDGAAGDLFGGDLAIADGVIAIGASHDDVLGRNDGSAYLFDLSTGEQLTKLVPTDGNILARFGNSIAIGSKVVAIGAVRQGHKSSVYLFSANTGLELYQLNLGDNFIDDEFGTAIDIDNGVVAIGAPGESAGGQNAGAAYLFDASTGTQLLEILPKDSSHSMAFGNSIAIHDGIVAIGAWLDIGSGDGSGSVYLFDTASGEQLAKLVPDDGFQGMAFGSAVAIDNDIVAIGAMFAADNGIGSGAVYLFNAKSGLQLAKIIPNDGALFDRFGITIAFSHGLLSVGAPNTDENGFNSGSAYIFDISTAECPADVNGDGALDMSDLDAWISAYHARNIIADQNNNGTLEPADFTAWIANFNAGCG